jgi:short subunit dehydrogenase-like uncharacterized protein
VYAIVRQLQPTAYGAVIQEEIEQRHQKDVSAGWLYTTLDRLEQGGYLRSELKEMTDPLVRAARGGRVARFWYPTAKRRPEPQSSAVSDWDDGLQPA